MSHHGAPYDGLQDNGLILSIFVLIVINLVFLLLLFCSQFVLRYYLGILCFCVYGAFVCFAIYVGWVTQICWCAQPYMYICIYIQSNLFDDNVDGLASYVLVCIWVVNKFNETHFLKLCSTSNNAIINLFGIASPHRWDKKRKRAPIGHMDPYRKLL
jgi:hypothetical protein